MICTRYAIGPKEVGRFELFHNAPEYIFRFHTIYFYVKSGSSSRIVRQRSKWQFIHNHKYLLVSLCKRTPNWYVLYLSLTSHKAAVKDRTCSLKPSRTSPTSPIASETDGNQLHVTSSAICSSPLGSSDPGSMALSQESSVQMTFSPAKQLSEDHYDLRREINDLIQLEFSYPTQRGSPARTGMASRNQATCTENRATTPRLSEPK